ncbi:arf-GAP domain and FG repeat-containing protein 1 isoform X2 [Drosophila navojoa]|uniref:arf-GAP domain and FG repeat-containing protein 1 isoform X2 n=1 Tax=Drosophila navojoa TaxID=7232 RepID=UPI0011BF4272|nr:arf-GAP domain and FG repeat-containing protein 1 isoform X2 [Drosophila navojoa]
MAVRKKQDDKYLLALRELVNSGAGNRQCFDCNQKGPTYVNMTIGSFVCTRCSGVLRGLTPPHRVKSISMATFTQDEIDFLKAHGNELCAKTWLGLWDPKRAAAQQDQRELMIDKYERKRYYLEPASPLKSLNLKSTSSSSSTSTASNGYHTGNISSNGYASIHLTPPAAQRTAANGLSKSAASSTAISRPQHHHHHHQHQNQNHNGNHDGFSHNLAGLGLGLTSLNSAGSTSTGALSDTSSCASNGFAGESDFVADFGSANIFDATSARSTGSPAVSSTSSVSSINGYAKVQPIRAAHLQQQQQQQQQMLNGNSTGSENFADFEHAPIYNGVADGTALQSQQLNQATSKPSPRASNAPSEDRYAALKDLDEQLRELKASEAATVTEAPTPTNGNTQLADAFGTVNGNSSSSNNNNSNNNHVNPFKSQQSLLINGSSHLVNPFQAQQLQQQQLLLQQQQQQQQQNLYGQLTLLPNGYGSSPQQAAAAAAAAAAATSFYNFNNNGFALAQGLPNGCGFGSMQPAPVLAGGLAGGFNNPFAASGAMNTNNPFL